MNAARGKERFRRLGVGVAAVAALALLAAGPAQARDRVVAVKAAPAPGPAKFDRVFVHQFGPAKGNKVLVLMPGTIAGAGQFTLAARYLVKRVKGLQVWAVDRRSQVLEDTSMFKRGLNGTASLQEVYDYYLGWIDNGGTPADHFSFLDTENGFPFARDWGMKVALDDVRRVVKLANRGDREVVLGGHSLGASLSAAYAAWDFGGRAGFRDLDGIVMIDGGLLGSFDAFDLDQAKQAISDLEGSNPFADLIDVGLPEGAGLFAEIGGVFAARAPTASATITQGSPLLPPAFNPPFPVSNEALLAHAFDRETSPPSLELFHLNAGGLAPSGNPRQWVDGGITPAARITATFGQEPSNGVEWYYPRRLNIDTNAANQMRRNAAARFLGLRLTHSGQIDIPIYAIQTDLTDGGVLRGARNLIRRAKTRKRQSMLVNADPQQSHLDPLMAAPATNVFLKTVTKFLRNKAF